MKRKSMFYLSFFLMLYIAPLIFTMSYDGSTIPTVQNVSKDFRIASEWYNESWHYRKSIDINGSVGAGVNYQIKISVTYDSNMQDDFDDLRFTDNDETTELDYWIEEYTLSTSAVVWVEVADSLETDTTIYMYYGNPSAVDASNGTATFLVYEDWASESIRTNVWDIVTSGGSVSYSAVDATHGTIAKFDAGDQATYRITSDYDTSSPTAVMFLSKIEEATTGNTARQGSGWDGAFSFALIQTIATGEKFYVYDDLGNQDSKSISTQAYFDLWCRFQITRDGTNAKFYSGNDLIETASCEPDLVTTNPATSIMVTDNEDDLYSDWIAVRKFLAIEPVFDSFGAEEDNLEWRSVGEAEILFSVPLDETAMNWMLVFLGLCMIPASTLYLVKGGKDNLSFNKVFFFLVAFMLGWAIFLGGIYG